MFQYEMHCPGLFTSTGRKATRLQSSPTNRGRSLAEDRFGMTGLGFRRWMNNAGGGTTHAIPLSSLGSASAHFTYRASGTGYSLLPFS
jgi:hypothetical protein